MVLFLFQGEDLGVAMSGLKHIAQELLVVASLSTKWDSIEMKYLGGSGTFPSSDRVRNLKFATYLKFTTCENTNKLNELW